MFTDKRAMKYIEVFGLKAMTDPCLSRGQSLALEVSVFFIELKARHLWNAFQPLETPE